MMLKNWFMLLALTVMWGSAFYFTELALASVSPTTVVAGRLLIALGVLGVFIVFLRSRLPKNRTLWAYLVAIAIVGNVLPYMLISWGQQRIDSGLAGILMAVMPLVTLSLAHLLIEEERMTRQRALGFIIGFVGIIVLLGNDAIASLRGVGGELVAMLAVLAGAVSYAFSAILSRLRPKSDPIATAGAVTLIGTLFAISLLDTESGLSLFRGFNQTAILAIALLGVFSTGMATVIYFKLIESAGPSFVSLLNYLIPLWAVGVGKVFLGEEFRATDYFALFIIIAGISVAQVDQWRWPLQKCLRQRNAWRYTDTHNENR